MSTLVATPEQVTTAEKAAATLLRQIEGAKRDIAAKITKSLTEEGGHVDAERLAKEVNILAEAEGKAWAWGSIAMALANGATVEQAILTVALRRVDDSWSGRANDNRRAYADGVRLAADDAVWRLR